ncbi:phytanoyl-CoA dioxygenase family protein [Yunchengibacter salinarum]|uniref:phytanoyl-CoA dioxygenase family protein n=1 Tax=Yunchengibacter salinarum TaxID=3133399 RepID=UPI0035B6398E
MPKPAPHPAKLILKRPWLLPVWLLSPLTGAKSFRDNPVLASHIANRLGLHVARVMLAHLVARLRWALLTPLMDRQARRRFHRDGFVVFEDALDPETIAALRADLEIADGTGLDVRAMQQGNTLTERLLLDRLALARLPAIDRALKAARMGRRVAYAAGKARAPLLYVQRIRNGAVAGGSDPQKTLHSDTFHPSVKAWLFLQDVAPEDGPFTYVPGSHRLSWRRLAFEYRKSLTARTAPDGYSEKGSLRLREADRKAMGLADPMGLSVKAGTLVVANTHGFHGRGAAQEGRGRLELWAYARPTPFNPLPVPLLPLAARLDTWGLRAYRAWQDRRAARRGAQPSWRTIPLGRLTEPPTEPSTGQPDRPDRPAITP